MSANRPVISSHNKTPGDNKVNTFRQNVPQFLTNRINYTSLASNINPSGHNQNYTSGGRLKTGKNSRKEFI